jgi:hypothetical protein
VQTSRKSFITKAREAGSRRSLLAVGAGVLVAFGLLNPAGAGTKNTGGGYRACGTDGNITWTPAVLWPPNHKAQEITFVYTDPDAGQKSLAITTNLHNEVVNGEEINGTGNTPVASDATAGPPATGSGSSVTVTGSAVSERSGHKNESGGRIYEFDYVASNDEDGDTTDGCQSSATVSGDGLLVKVPHDCRGGACQAQAPATGP